MTPYDLGYGIFVKFDHDFIGREALEKIANKPHRVKVTLELNDEDVQKVIASQYGKDGDRAKFIEFPSAVYSMYPQDKVLSKDGKQVGISTWVGYSSNERKQLTLAYVAPEFVEAGHGSHLRLGRGERRLEEAHRRASQAGADPRHRLPGAVRGVGAHGLCGRQLARDRQAVSTFERRGARNTRAPVRRLRHPAVVAGEEQDLALDRPGSHITPDQVVRVARCAGQLLS